MSVIQVGLVDTTGKLDATLLEACAAALNIQVMRDLHPTGTCKPRSDICRTPR